MDGSYLEYQIFGLIRIDIMSLIRTKASLSKSFHLSPTEIDQMPMWEYELFIKALNELVEEENNQQKGEMDKYKINDYTKMANPKNFQKMTQGPDFSKMNFGDMSNMGNMNALGKIR